MEDHASSQTPDHETTFNTYFERINLDGNSIISTPDKLLLDNMPSVDNLGLATTSLSVLSEKDEIDFLGSSAKTLHKTISDYVDQNFGSNRHILAQCSDNRDSPLLKFRNQPKKITKRQKPIKDPAGKSEPSTQPPKQCPIQICRPGYKAAVERRKSRQFTKDDLTSSTTDKPNTDFKASDRSNFEFKPSIFTRVDSGPIKVRKIQRTGAKPTPFKGNIKENKSSKLRSEFNRKEASIPSHVQDHLNKYKKPPFRKTITHPQACFDDIVERLQNIKKLVPGKGASSSTKRAADKSVKSHKPRKTTKRAV